MTLHGAFADFEGTENVVNEDKVYAYEKLAKKKLSMATFSNNWFDGVRFPLSHALRLKNAGITPLVRIMPRSNFKYDRPDPNFSLAAIASGYFDRELNEWARDCALLGSKVLIDFACEMNGKWFPWSKEDPKLYIKAYRRVYTIVHAIAPETEFVWHVNYDKSHANLAKYYPGNDFIDYVGASIYGNHKPNEKPTPFSEIARYTFDNLDLISAKPKAISEIGVTESKPGVKAKWIEDGFADITATKRYAFVSWWHSKFTMDEKEGPINYRVDSSPESLAAYQKAISSPNFK